MSVLRLLLDQSHAVTKAECRKRQSDVRPNTVNSSEQKTTKITSQRFHIKRQVKTFFRDPQNPLRDREHLVGFPYTETNSVFSNFNLKLILPLFFFHFYMSVKATNGFRYCAFRCCKYEVKPILHYSLYCKQYSSNYLCFQISQFWKSTMHDRRYSLQQSNNYLKCLFQTEIRYPHIPCSRKSTINKWG